MGHLSMSECNLKIMRTLFISHTGPLNTAQQSMALTIAPSIPAHVSSSRESEPWAERFRPSHLDEVECISPHAVHHMRRILDGGKTPPHMLLYGPPGTGKTTAAHLFAVEVMRKERGKAEDGCDVRKLLEVNGSCERRMEDLVQLKQFVERPAREDDPARPRLRVLVVDEAEGLPEGTQLILRDLLDVAVHQRVIVILCVNNRSSLAPSLSTACFSILFSPASDDVVRTITRSVVDRASQTDRNLGLVPPQITDGVMNLVVFNAKGDIRAAINSTNSIYSCFLGQDIDAREVRVQPEDAKRVSDELVPFDTLHDIFFANEAVIGGAWKQWDAARASERLISFVRAGVDLEGVSYGGGNMPEDVVSWLVQYAMRIERKAETPQQQQQLKVFFRLVTDLVDRIESGARSALQFRGFCARLWMQMQ